MPVAAGSVGATSTSIVGRAFFFPALACDGEDATLDIGDPPGRGLVVGQRDPDRVADLDLACWAASSAILTWRAVELTVSTGPGMTARPTVGITRSRGPARLEHDRAEQQLAGHAQTVRGLQRAYRRGRRGA